MKCDVESRFRLAIDKYNMLDDAESVLVGFSGGADSTALLTLLCSLGTVKVAALHVNHCIRGDEADRDEMFCRNFCEKNGITFYCEKVDVPKIASENRSGIEETARELRYSFLSSIAKKYGYDRIATAHNSSDNTETVLFHLIRGSAIEGLCGIPPVRDNIIRPLILCSKSDITEYCTQNGIDYVTDSTNSDTAYTRNYIRCEIIPMMKKLNTSLDDSVSSASELLRYDRDTLRSISEKYSLSDGRRILSSLDDSILMRVLKRNLEAYGIAPLSFHLRSAVTLIRSDKSNFVLSMPGGNLVCDRDTVTCDNENLSTLERQSLTEGINYLSDGSAVVIIPNGMDYSEKINILKKKYAFSTHISINCDKIDNMEIRSRLAGDKYRFGNMTRSVRKLLQQKKTTAAKRSLFPVFICNNEIVWVAGFAVSDSAKPANDTDCAEIYYFSDN